MILAARSVTSALALPILLSLVWLFALSRRRPFPFVLALVIFAAAGIACVLTLFIDPSDILTLAGRDSTMSGRLDIWSAVVPKIMAHPWLGYGYSSFWLGTEGQASSDLWSMLHWNVPHSHNGFFDLAEELGVVGLGIFIAGFIMSANRGLRWARNQQALIGLWPLTYLSFMLFFNLSEGSILRQDNLFWVLYVATFVFVMNKTSDPIPETLQESATNSWFSLRAPFVSTGSARENMGIQ
jgi:O-antigen ligase